MESSNFAQLIKQETLTSHAHYDVDVPLPPLPPNPSITSFCNSLVSADDSFLAPPPKRSRQLRSFLSRLSWSHRSRGLSSNPPHHHHHHPSSFSHIHTHVMASVSTLPGPALQASKAALSSALAENLKDNEKATNGDQSLEPGEIQEVDMQAQADNIRTVFNDPTNFNVKVRCNFVNPSAIPPSRWSRVHSFVVLTMWAQ